MYAHSYLQTARRILELYDGSAPFAVWLKQFFKNHKKHGSRDRRHIAHLCYCCFRLGSALEHLGGDEQVVCGAFLCSTGPDALLEQLNPDLNAMAGNPLAQKIKWLEENKGFSLQKLFPAYGSLSPAIDGEEFCRSHFIQPDLFLRIRPGQESSVKQKLEKAGIPYAEKSSHTIALPNSTRTEDLPEADTEVVIQDLSSQRTLDLLLPLLDCTRPLTVWDCCAASGGKSLLLHDRCPSARLTVSDIRESILANLQKRFQRAGISQYRSLVFDASRQSLSNKFDVVLCDAPCSGSGTWGRTPEQLRFFPKEKISHYSGLQKSIVLNASRSLRTGGYFLYITCSVFKEENESVVAYIQQNTALRLLASQYYKGYGDKADTLFVAVFGS
ncbi:MAG TPA: methyltransferase domain-containing protein [Flavisolibacter sp.]